MDSIEVSRRRVRSVPFADVWVTMLTMLLPSVWSFRSVFGFCVSEIAVNTDNEQQLVFAHCGRTTQPLLLLLVVGDVHDDGDDALMTVCCDDAF